MRLHFFSINLAVAVFSASLAEARIFTDSFSGRGRGCTGPLIIGTKTIEWDTDFSSCRSRYTILKKTFADRPKNFDYILYKLNRPNKTCPYPYIGLYYYEYSNDPGMEYDWQVAGFSTFQQYKNFPYQKIVTGQTPGPDDVLDCQLPFFSGNFKKFIPY